MDTADWHTPVEQTLADKLAVGWSALTALVSPSSWETQDFVPRIIKDWRLQ